MSRQVKKKRNHFFVSLLFGGLIILGSFLMLWLNEGRTNFAEVARDSISVTSERGFAGNDEALVALTGELVGSERIGDDLFLRLGDYVWLNRYVEMYAWTEEEESEGEQTEIVYRRVWTNFPQAPTTMQDPIGHENPAMPYEAIDIYPHQVTIGNYQIDIANIDKPDSSPLPLTTQTIKELPYPLAENYIFIGEGSLVDPIIGDVRISYQALNAGTLATVFGTIQENKIRPFVTRNNETLHRLLLGTRSEAIAQLDTEYKTLLWSFRTGGFFLMWLGFGLALSPINWLFGFIPATRRLGFWLVAGISFLIAAPVSIMVIIISYLLHNIWALLFVLALLGGGIYFLQQRQKQATEL